MNTLETIIFAIAASAAGVFAGTMAALWFIWLTV